MANERNVEQKAKLTGKMSIHRRVLLLLLSAGILSFLALGVVSLWGMYSAQHATIKNGMHMGTAATTFMENLATYNAQKQLLDLAIEKAQSVDRELVTIRMDTERIAFVMERLLSHPTDRMPKTLKEPTQGPIAFGEAFLYRAPSLRTPEAIAGLSQEIGLVSNIADVLENTASFYNGYQFGFTVASKKGYMISVEMEPGGKGYVNFTEKFLTGFVPQERPWFKSAEKAGATGVSAVYMGYRGMPEIAYTVPYWDARHEFAGVACLAFGLPKLYEDIAAKSLKEDWISFALDPHGVIIFSSEKEGPLMVSDDLSDFRESSEVDLAREAVHMVEGESNVSLVTMGEESYYLAYAPMPSVGWSLGLLVRVDDVVAPAQSAREQILARYDQFTDSMGAFFSEKLREMAVLFLVVLGGLCLGSRKAADWFVHPILALTDGVREIAKGNLDKKLDIKTGDEIEILADSVNHMTKELKEYMSNLSRVTADKERIATELNLARGIQEGMLPNIFPKFSGNPHYDLFATMNAAKEVGGDFYDFYVLDEEHLLVTIGDVSGKGVPAALFMVISKTMLKNDATSAALSGTASMNWAEIVARANRQLCENNEEMMFVTVFFGVLNIRTGVFTYVNAGHNAPLIGRVRGDHTDWEYIRDEKKSQLMGIMENAEYEEKHLTLAPGDMLFFYTDGVTEAMDGEGRLYSEERLQETLRREGTPTVAMKELLTEIQKDIDAHAKGADQSDDITMVGVKFKG